MARADVILVLVSPAYLESRFARREMDIAAKESREGSALVIPIIVRECDWRVTPLAELQALPTDLRPIMADEDPSARATVWSDVALQLRELLRQQRKRLLSRRQAILPPRIVALVGSEGIGRFMLARKLVHDPAVSARHPYGILWLGEDGSGYPRQWLRDYCARTGESAPLNERGIVDSEGFRTLFADRSVLFIADQRAASDMVPSLTEHAGSDCTVLVFASHDAPLLAEDRLVRVDLAPLRAEAVEAAAQAFAMPPDAQAEDDIAFADGIPLLLRLAAGLTWVVGLWSLSWIAGEWFRMGDGSHRDAQRKATAILVE